MKVTTTFCFPLIFIVYCPYLFLNELAGKHYIFICAGSFDQNDAVEWSVNTAELEEKVLDLLVAHPGAITIAFNGENHYNAIVIAEYR